ncbi:Bicarbonate transporter, partial [Trema orientale]
IKGINSTIPMPWHSAPADATMFDIENEIDGLLPVEVKEHCPSNLLQSTMVAGCVTAMPFSEKDSNLSSLGLYCFYGHRKLNGKYKFA